MVTDPEVLHTLREIVGGPNLLVDDDLTGRYRTDFTGRFHSDHAVVARPGTVAEVAAVVTICADHELAIVPQGGVTGLVGGSIPLEGELVVSTERLVGIESVDASVGQITARAGTPLADVQRAAGDAGWRYGVDIASRDTATIGGNVATNAGGLRVVRYGPTRSQVVGVELVTGTGALIGTSAGTLRDNTGYHLPSIVCGSEGTLGVITGVRVRLMRDHRFRTTALMRFERPGDAAVAVESLRGILPSVESAEIFFAPGLELVCTVFSWPPPFTGTAGGYVLVEAAGDTDQTEALGAAVELMVGVGDVAVAEDASGRERLWRYRERHTEAIATVGNPHKLDIAVPPGSLAAFVDVVPDAVAAVDPDATVWLFGHGGEAAVHVNVTGPADDDDSVDDAVLRLVAEMGGSISAEHGIGTAKMRWIGLAHDPVERDLRRRIKAAFDPNGIMNPAVLIPSACSGR